jgi:cell cycle related kinase
MTELPDFNKITFPDMPPIPLECIVPDASPDALDLLKQFLVYASSKRISAAEALVHSYFFTEPLPAHHSELPIPARNAHKVSAASMRPDFDVNAPVERYLVNPKMLKPHTRRFETAWKHDDKLEKSDTL